MTLPVYDMSAAARLPRAAVDRVCAVDRAVLLVHDMHERNALFDGRSPMAELVHNVGKLRDTCHDLDVPVAYSARSAGVVGAPEPRGHWIEGEAAEHYANLRGLLDRHGRDQLIVTGVRAHAACLMAAAGPALVGVEVFCVADAIADLSLDEHRHAVRAATEHGATATTTSLVIGQLLGVLV